MMNRDELERMVSELSDRRTPPDIIRNLVDIADEDNEYKDYDVIIEDSTEDVIYQNDVNKIINEALNEMPKFDKRVIELRFGFNGNDRHTREEIVEELNSTIEKVRNAEDRAIRKLRHPKYSSRLIDYIDLGTKNTKVTK